MDKVSGKSIDLSILTRIFSFAKPYTKIFIWTVVFTIVLAVLAPVRPWLIQYTLDTHVAGFDTQGLVYMTLILVAIMVLQSIIQFFHTYFTGALGQWVIRDLRVRLFGHLIHFRTPYFDRTPVGTPVTRMVSDMETIADIFSDGLLIIIGDILQLIAILFVMFYVDWRLALISLSTIPFLILATRSFKNNIKAVFNEVRLRVAELNVFVNEHLTGMLVTQIFNKEKDEMVKFDKINQRHRDANIKSVWYYSIFFPVVEILSAISIGLIIWWGSHGVIKDQVSFGTLVSFIMYIGLLFRPMRELADKFNTLQMGMVSSERIFNLLDTHTGVRTMGEKDASEIRGEIRFEKVWFAYADEDWVLKDISFTIQPGQIYAIVGSTGAGKSTIISLINRFYDIQKGNIYIDGVDIMDYELNSLRRKVALVMQDVFLFSDSIYNNITLFDPGIELPEVKEAARVVGADHFIESLPGAYDFNVRERGLVLSSGQRQLISFIRAYVFKPAILILDEATSSLDSESEQLISNATQKLTFQRTSIVIAHRLSTIQSADCILVMEKGRIVQSGKHEDMIKEDGVYKKLYDIQFSTELST